MSLVDQVVDDMRKSKAKAALLGVLTLVGLYFWVPLLLDLVRGSAQSQTSSAPVVAQPTVPRQPVAGDAEPGHEGRRLGRRQSRTPDQLDWKEAEQVLAEDPLVQPPAEFDVTADPFEINHDQFSPPVTDIFADEPEAKATDQSETPAPVAPEKPTGLVLKSTIVGVHQRAAFINDQVCFEGSRLVVNGRTFQVVSIGRDRVELQCEGRTFVLEIDEKKPSGTAGRPLRVPGRPTGFLKQGAVGDDRTRAR